MRITLTTDDGEVLETWSNVRYNGDPPDTGGRGYVVGTDSGDEDETIACARPLDGLACVVYARQKAGTI